jgi:aminoglycoside phosphotransferase (APT) family kinase protein
MSRAMHPAWVFLDEREAHITPPLPDGAPFPRWRFTIDDGDWVALGFDVIDGREATIPWHRRDLDRVIATHLAMADRLHPSPVPVERAGEIWGDAFTRWRDLDRTTVERRVSAEFAWHLDELCEMELTWPAHTDGDHLVHLDFRADNVLLTGDEVYVVDWAFAARGQPWMDLVCLLPNVAMRGGADPETMWQAHPWHARTDPESFDAFLVGWAGMLTQLALADGSPSFGALRQFHAEQAAEARRWLARRRGWGDVAS